MESLNKIRDGKVYSELTDAEAMEIYPVLSVNERKRLLAEKYAGFISFIIESINNPNGRHRKKIAMEAIKKWFLNGCEVSRTGNEGSVESLTYLHKENIIEVERKS